MDTPARPSSSRKRWLIRSVAAVVVLAALLAVPVRHEVRWMDALGGARRAQSTWLGGAVTRDPVVTPSPLETRFRAMGLSWEPDWRQVGGTYHNVFGVALRHYQDLAPPVYLFEWSMQQTFVDFSTEEDVQEFFDAMSSGKPSEQALAIAGANSKVFTLLLEGVVSNPDP